MAVYNSKFNLTDYAALSQRLNTEAYELQICQNHQITLCKLFVFRSANGARLQLVAPPLVLAVEALPLHQ